MARITTLHIQCPQCGNIFESLDARRKFCNQSCAASYNNNIARAPKRKKIIVEKAPRKSTVDKWLDGEYDGTVKAGLSATIRTYLIEQANYKCSECGWSGFNSVTGKSTLQVDHIDGDCSNNAANNLKVLCPNCHSLTPTYGALNKGNGRKARYGIVAQSVEHDIANVEVAGS